MHINRRHGVEFYDYIPSQFLDNFYVLVSNSLGSGPMLVVDIVEVV